MFLYKIQFLLIFSFLSIPIELWESTAAIFRQSAGYVFFQFFGSDFLNGFANPFIVQSRPSFFVEPNFRFSPVVFCSHEAF